ncbi:acyl-CoA thioesterase [Subsaxibacter sp. CAU 1640]|uniref:acyl-CoA thioesterase n=1 Tax=Subsaxibacter sp. CAU 1640 TaxID=2933271 RepID=UPI0020032ED4|nr:thioesterase family protein [Subsaxibacter sp. CAU 1640]MCK7591216.1 acyl-CoA thioesterase [Subsaxibacter sp. CAU 1640]
MQTFEKHHIVEQEDLDHLNHVNNVRYVQWVQDIAEAHWKSKASEDIQESFFWVLMKHTIEYKNEAILGDVLKMVTYVKKSEGVTSIRMVEIYDENTNKLLATSETTWCFMNVSSKRPARIPKEIVDLFN